MLVDETAATPLRTPAPGLGTALQLVPSQCMMPLLPTAHTLSAATADTPFRPPNWVVEMDQSLPSQCMMPLLPTAHTSFVAWLLTPLSAPTLGPVTWLQPVPSQCAMSDPLSNQV